jgi:mannose-6-phosphate isomerase
MIAPRPYLLKNSIQNYSWGSKGKFAFIPNLIGITPQPKIPYAELWMGAHPNAPSKIFLNNSWQPLDSLISNHPQLILGKKVLEKFSAKLPFLFKVLSAAEPLSIQSHPNKQQARELHEQDPEHYPDNNHKPEIAIALDSLTALIGFRPVSEIQSLLDFYPEITSIVGQNRSFKKNHPSKATQNPLKEIYSALIETSINKTERLEKAVSDLQSRLLKNLGNLNERELLFLKMTKQYPQSDPGLFSIFLLNLIHLNEGEAVFLDAGIPHAYIKGNIIECMANSDNVIRAGLTPKYRDAVTLLRTITYRSDPIQILRPENFGKKRIFLAPVDEFQISQNKILINQKDIPASEDSLKIILITQGTLKIAWSEEDNNFENSFHKGQSILIPANLKNYSTYGIKAGEFYEVTIPS